MSSHFDEVISMIHLFNQGLTITGTTFVLLHGTGGDEHDLLALAKEYDETANVLSIRGNVQEHGMNRFFKRLSPGVFDLDDLRFRTSELLDFIQKSADRYGFSMKSVVIIGYSNGANIAAAMLLLHPLAIAGAVLQHPMLPLPPMEVKASHAVQVLITASTNDTIVPYASAEKLHAALASRGHAVTFQTYHHGHQLTTNEIVHVKSWLQDSFRFSKHL
jgi:phospholipase/carboxylesterase